ncbi:hypothetical protein L873DRAFT_1249045 [Choiromyces venosus 120613-1]|uniref:Uncharacterized protein n=1 Tax=Choiromyces venosus 120613-1 TaxID=1336337 RepID=A0A3N4JHJ1_9PEZI|nr:hypothetical protein L873DRAFT_1249045 [Choiromyces venosus 120613-1]
MAWYAGGAVSFVTKIVRTVFNCSTALSGEGRFQARRSKESVAQHPSSFEERVAFRGRIFTNFCHRVQFSRPLPVI